ncbi:MAG: MMPL family transporter, partial [Thermodesulfobacteriota bacterium]|nr:MMPL family transporter [Thermodesulfobacteriota bacterium]
KLTMTRFSIRHPWLIIFGLLILTAVFFLQFPKVRFDNDPENMLSPKEYVRIFNDEVKAKYNLYDFVIVGIVNDQDPDGIFNPKTLGRIYDLTYALLSLNRDSNQKPVIIRPSRGDQEEERVTLDLSHKSLWEKFLGMAFRHDPNNLFDEDGNSAIIGREIISPSLVDNIKQADLGSLKLEYLMERPPVTREEALTIRDDAMGNPLYSGTLVSEDEKAICVYIPIIEKTFSYNVAKLVRELTRDWGGDDKIYITGLPVAEDTFGVEMMLQMAESAPMAGVIIFLLLLFFFRRISLIIAPMIVAVISVICTMGLLIWLGFEVHIMSSMIAIFLMPIAVADSVHVLSLFYDTYAKFNDRAETINHVIGHLFMPMLYTSLTTIAGFASLGTTPIPPVRVFGLHVAFGVALAWVLTLTLIPAYIMVAVPEKKLRALGSQSNLRKNPSERLARVLGRFGEFGYMGWKFILIAVILIMGISAYGISKIKVNDNPVKWFAGDHEIRVADRVLNNHFGGTYTAYLTLSAPRPEVCSCIDVAEAMDSEANKRFREYLPAATDRFLGELRLMKQLYCNVNSSNAKKCFVELVNKAEQIDSEALNSWNNLADAINYMEPEGLTFDVLIDGIRDNPDIKDTDRRIFIDRLEQYGSLTGESLLNQALDICDEILRLSFKEFVFEIEAELTAPLFKQPKILRYVEEMQKHLMENPVVGKTSSAVDALKKASYELLYISPPSDATKAEKEDYDQRNRQNFSIPGSASATGQVFIQLEGMKKKDSLFHMVTKDYQEANLWVQLKSGDNRDMEKVVEDMEGFLKTNQPPVDLKAQWAGLTYLNIIWQNKMVKGMITSLGASFIVVLVMMALLFRSPLYGAMAMIPLSLTIASIYGIIGLAGKDYDMPVAILSAMTLGLSVDFAIHFLQRARESQRELHNWKKVCQEMFKEPAMAISRNAIIISLGFTPLLLAPLVPYKTVGFFLATIMAVSWLATLFTLPAVMTALKNILFKEDGVKH